MVINDSIAGLYIHSTLLFIVILAYALSTYKQEMFAENSEGYYQPQSHIYLVYQITGLQQCLLCLI